MAGKRDSGSDGGGEKPGWRRRSLTACAYLLLGVAVAGLAVHYSVRDAWTVLAPLYYLIPPGAALLFSLPIFVIALRRGGKLRLLVSTAAIAASVFGVWRWDYRPAQAVHADNADVPATRVVAWNLADAFWGVETAGDGVEQLAPDVAVLFEAPTPEESREAFGERFPGCIVASFADNGLIIVKGSISDVSKKSLDGGSVALFEIEVGDVDLDLAVLDLTPTSFTSRASDLEAAAEAIERWRGNGPVILVASVHMPRNSVLLDRFLGTIGLRESFLESGSGLGTGWPSWLPVYHGEQFWVSKEFSVERSSAEWSLRSDHLPWVLEVGVR